MKKILLVEDNAFLSEIYTTILKDHDFDITVASNGTDGLEKASQGGWDLILMDVTLPILSGFEIAKKLKEKPPQKANTSLVFLTSLDSDEDIEKAKTLGDGFIKKVDVTPGDLLDRLAPYLNK